MTSASHPECIKPIGNNNYQCSRYGWIIHVPASKLPILCSKCKQPGRKHESTKLGPGDYLHLAILKWVGEGPTRQCGCTDRIAKMNAWGPAVCREKIDTIVDWLADEAKKRGWWKVVVAVPIIPRLFIRKMILDAIQKVEDQIPQK